MLLVVVAATAAAAADLTSSLFAKVNRNEKEIYSIDSNQNSSNPNIGLNASSKGYARIQSNEMCTQRSTAQMEMDAFDTCNTYLARRKKCV